MANLNSKINLNIVSNIRNVYKDLNNLKSAYDNVRKSVDDLNKAQEKLKNSENTKNKNYNIFKNINEEQLKYKKELNSNSLLSKNKLLNSDKKGSDGFKSLISTYEKLSHMSIDSTNMEQANSILNELETRLNNINIAIKSCNDNNVKIPDWAYKYKDTLEITSKSLSNVISNYNLGSIALEDYTNSLDESNKTNENNKQANENLKDSVSNLGVVMDGVAKKVIMDVLVISLKQAVKATEHFQQDMLKLSETLGTGFVDSISLMVDGFDKLIDIMSEVIDKIGELTDRGIELQEGLFRVFNYLGVEGGNEIIEYTNKLEKLFGLDSSNLINNLNGILGMTSNMGIVGDNLTTAIKGFESFFLDLNTFSPYDLELLMSGVESAVSNGVLRTNSPIARALNLDDKEVKQFKELNSAYERGVFLLQQGEAIRGSYDRWLGTAAGKAERFKNSLDILHNSMSKLVLGLLQNLLPVITKIVEALNDMVVMIAKVLKIDLSTPDANNASEGYTNIANSIGKVGEQAEKSKRQVASFDDVIQINDSKDTDNNKIDTGDLDLSLFDSWINKTKEAKSEWDKFIESIKKDLESGDFNGAGQKIANKLTEILKSIPWKEYQKKAKEFGDNLAQFLNGFLSDEELYKKIGKTLAEGVNTIFIFLYTFLKDFDFNQLGSDLGLIWTNFWSNLDAESISGTLYEIFMGIFETVGGWLETADNSFGIKIADIINKFFGNITKEDIKTISDSIIGTINFIFSNIKAFLEELDITYIKIRISRLVKQLISGVMEHGEDWGSTLHDLISFIFDLGITILTTENENGKGLTDAISTFLDGLNLSDLASKWFYIQLELFKIKVSAQIQIFFRSLWGVIKGFISNYFLEIVGLVTGFIIGGPIGAIVGLGITSLLDYLLGFSDATKEIFNDILTFIGDVIANIFGAIGDFFSGIKNKISGLMDSLLGKKSSIDINENSTAQSISVASVEPIDIPQLAIGGIVNKSTIANIGEDGQEAVIPLEKNTGWMDELASKLVSKINIPQSNGGSVILDMNGYKKNFYTRNEMIEFAEYVVKALKIYGVKISVAY